jgi:hypothetical protein
VCDGGNWGSERTFFRSLAIAAPERISRQFQRDKHKDCLTFIGDGS